MMDLRSQMKVVDLLMKLFRGDMQHINPYPFVPQKHKNIPNADSGGLLRSIPEREGIPSGQIQRFFEELDACPSIHVHSAMVLRHGKIIAEGSWKPYSGSYPHMMFSLSKSVVSMAVGFAVQEGLLSLDDPAASFFPDKNVLFRSARISGITIRHLLNMTSGLKFNEVNSAVEKDWVRAILQSDCSFEPGTEFSYNSLNTYLLSAILYRKTGMGLVEYLTPRLFDPLGIHHVSWDVCPLGIEKGGWGLWLRIVDMAKLGQLYLQRGRWTVDGAEKQLLPESWIAEYTKMDTPTREGDYSTGYGYQIWSFGAKGAYQFNGMLGQYVIVLPERDMVLALTSGSPSLFADETCHIVEKYFGDGAKELSDGPLPNDIRALRSLRSALGNLYAIRETAPKPKHVSTLTRMWRRVFPEKQEVPTVPPELRKWNGCQYQLENSSAALMPLILQGTTNNFGANISRIGMEFSPGECRLIVEDGAETNLIVAGMDGIPRKGCITLNGEVYAIGSTARLTTDEDDRPVLKVFVCFTETPSVRVLKFILYSPEKMLIRFDELPSVEASLEVLFSLVGGRENQNSLNKLFMDTVGQQRLDERVAQVSRPRVKATLVKP